MSKSVIDIQGIGKRYSIGAAREPYLSLREQVAKRFSPAARRARVAEQEFWALKDVSFSVEPGEAVGIIGRNGAGKSTLLKILSQITPPTEGSITMRGRVGSLLEVGTGFHPELTGRENIYMNGAILGMGRKEIARKFDEIVAFAEMEKFLDTPVKRYSSGMYVRLAFAVAAHLEPEILVVDEVLAVGDTQFQRKCLGKMGEVAKGGRTVLFVSHNVGAITQLCARAILLDRGIAVTDGDSTRVVAEYLGRNRGGTEAVFSSVPIPGAPVSVVRAYLSSGGGPANSFDINDKLQLHLTYAVERLPQGAVLHFAVCRAGNTLFRSFITDCSESTSWGSEPGEHKYRIDLPYRLLTAGLYSVTISVGIPGGECFHEVQDALAFAMEEISENTSLASHSGARGALVIAQLKWIRDRYLEGEC